MADAQARPAEVTRMLDELHDLQRLQEALEPIALASLFLQAWAFVDVLRTGQGYLVACMTAVLATSLLVWALWEGVRSRRLERDLLPWLE